jgi:hypothetical protein
VLRNRFAVKLPQANVELIRVKDGATLAPPEACQMPTSDPLVSHVLWY